MLSAHIWGMNNMHLLEAKNLSYSYSNIRALKDVSFYVDEGEIVSIIGSNGAGKSTILNCVSGLLNKNGKSGEIFLNGIDISSLKGNKVNSLGITEILEGRHIFSQLTVEENLKMGAFLRKDNNIELDINQMYEMFPRLKERKNQLGGTLSGGEQQMLAIARALVSKPKLLLLDEPSLGLAPIIVNEIFEIIKKINKEKNITILLVEQNSRKALSISNRGYVLQNGEIKLEGTGTQLLETEEVKKYYLGNKK